MFSIFLYKILHGIKNDIYPFTSIKERVWKPNGTLSQAIHLFFKSAVLNWSKLRKETGIIPNRFMIFYDI